jgi:hypothetical protein
MLHYFVNFNLLIKIFGRLARAIPLEARTIYFTIFYIYFLQSILYHKKCVLCNLYCVGEQLFVNIIKRAAFAACPKK